jgi:predicted O-methyltransferase YrrM
MKILLTIPHFYQAQGEARHASQHTDPRPRLEALSECLTKLHLHFGRSQYLFDIQRTVAYPINQTHAHQLDVVICTTQGKHLLSHLSLPPNSYVHCETQSVPMRLGFECHAVLRDRCGQYDYYGYLEDDLILHDPWFFEKLIWFNKAVGNSCLLQPNRYESSPLGAVRKLYVDGNLAPAATAPFQNVQDQPEIPGQVLETPMRFVRPLNPHSGCFFLNAAQMEHWLKTPYYLDRDCSFVGPLESAATLGIMRTFRVYKPAPECAAFLEIQHFGTGFARHVGNGYAIVDPPPTVGLYESALKTLQFPGGGEAQARWAQIPGWFDPVKAQAIQQIVRQLASGARLAELGSFMGRSSIAIASVMPSDGRLWCVDHFQGSKEHHNKPFGDLDLFDEFQKNLEGFGVLSRVDVLRMNTLEAGDQIQPESLDFLLVDASHDYQSVKADLECWYPKLKRGGYLVCDDYHTNWPGVMQAVNEMHQPGQVVAGALWVHRRPIEPGD